MVSVYDTVSVNNTVSLYNTVSVYGMACNLPLRQCAGARIRVGERITPAHTTSSIGEITTTFTNQGNA